MKKLLLLLFIITFLEVIPQTTRPAKIEIPITIFDNSGLPNSSRVLTCGIDSMATDSIDSFLGEYWLYCPFASENNSDCIPFDHFEAVLDLPNPPFLHRGTWKDFRYGDIPFSGTKTYTLVCLPYYIATSLYISWDFPEGVTGLLQDPFGGVILNYQMPDSGTFTDPDLMTLAGIGVNLVLTYQNTIPVEFASFTASVLQSEKAVQLYWTSTTETNNSGFEILCKTQNDNEWSTIGFVPGFGTTTEPKSYSFVDEDVTTGTYNYRLKQIDFDGTFTYSNEVEVEVDFTPKEFVLYQNYPNPFNPTTTISYSIPQKGVVTLRVFDALGNEIAKLVNEEKQSGIYEIEFDGTALTSGIYFYKLQVGSFFETKKMVLMK